MGYLLSSCILYNSFFEVLGILKPFANFAEGEFAPSLRGDFQEGFKPPEAYQGSVKNILIFRKRFGV